MRFNWLRLKDVENISEVLFYRRLEFRYSLEDVLINTVHAVLWCRHVFARSCVHMFICVVFTLGRLARFGCIEL